MFTSNQTQFQKVFMRKAMELLSAYLLNKPQDDADKADTALDTASNVVNSASAVATVVGLAGAPASLGGSLVLPIASITILQTGRACYKIVKRYINSDKEYSPDESKYDELLLSLKILVREISDALAINYRHSIDKILTKQEITEFAHEGVACVVELIKKDFNTHHMMTLNAKQMIDALIESMNASTTTFLMRSSYARRVYSRTALAVAIQQSNEELQYILYDSLKEKYFGHKDSALDIYGCRTINFSESFESRKLKKTVVTPEKERDLKQNLMIYYPVTPVDIEQYIQHIRQDNGNFKPVLSFNQYISQRVNTTIIATSKENMMLDHLDMEGGDFSEVSFRRVTIKSCNLKRSIWKDSHLEESTFDQNPLDDSIFEHTYIEKSKWSNTRFTGNFLRARMAGSELINSQLSLTWQHIGCDIELVVLKNVPIEEPLLLLENRLTNEYNERMQWRKTQETQWEAQQTVDRQFENRISALEYQSQRELLRYLSQNIDRVLNTPSFQRVRVNYIERDLLSFAMGEQHSSAAWDVLEQFMQTEAQQFMLIIGGVFDGMSATSLMWIEELRHQDTWALLYFKLENIQAKTQDNFLHACLESVLDNAQITTLMESFSKRCFIVLDGLEHCDVVLQRSIVEECRQLNQEWQQGAPKFLLLAQEQFIYKYHYAKLLRISSEQLFPMAWVYGLMPVSDDKRERYVNRYKQRHLLFLERYEHLIALDNTLQSMLNSPFMIHLICEIALELAENDRFFSSVMDFYEAFYERWNKHAKTKVFIDNLTLDDLVYYARQLSYVMATLGQDWVNVPFKDKRLLLQTIYERAIRTQTHEPIACLLEHPPLDQVSYVMPLSTTLVQTDVTQPLSLLYQFKPKSLGHYALAQKLLVSLFVDSNIQKLDSWNCCFLTQMPNVLQFMQKSLMLDPRRAEAEQYLLAFIAMTKSNDGKMYIKAASNAISLLNLLSFNFSERVKNTAFSEIKIPKAYLVKAALNGLDMQNSDMSDSDAAAANFRQTNLMGTNLTNSRFWKNSAFMSTSVAPLVFTAHPVKSLIAFDMTQDELFIKKSAIMVVNISNDYQYDFYTNYTGHQKQISCLRWSAHDVLASGDIAGVIRLWALTQDTKSQVLGSLQAHDAEVNSLVWLDNDRFLASASHDKTLQIWDAVTQTRVYSAKLFEKPIERMFWHNEQLITIHNEKVNKISFWQVDPARTKMQMTKQCTFETLNAKQIAISPDNTSIAIGLNNGAIQIQCLADQHQLCVLIAHTDEVNVLIWNEHYLVSASKDKTIRVWDTEQQSCVAMYNYEQAIDTITWLSNQQDLIWLDKTIESGFCIWNTQSTEHSSGRPLLSVDACNVTDTIGLSSFDALTFKRDGAVSVKDDRNRLFNGLNQTAAQLAAFATQRFN